MKNVQRTTWAVLATLVLSFMPCWAGPALAGASDDKAAAQDLAGKAAVLAKQGQYEEAAAMYEKAHALDPVPVLLFNLGYVHEKRGADGDALDAYRRYLKEEKDPKLQADVQTRIRTVEARVAAKRAALPTKAPEKPAKKTAARWWLIGAGTALVVGGGVAMIFLLRDNGGGSPSPDATWTLPGGGGP
jgi:tetratricopeptide (TPR) repeat protein